MFNSLHPLVPILGAARLKMPLLVVQGDDLQLESLLLHVRSALRVALHPPMPLLDVGRVPAVLSLLLLLAPARLPQNLIPGQSDLEKDVLGEAVVWETNITSPLLPLTPLLWPPLLLTPPLPIRGTGLIILKVDF